VPLTQILVVNDSSKPFYVVGVSTGEKEVAILDEIGDGA
jgi:hypothetical protein